MLAALNHKLHHTRISFRIKYPSIILCMYLISHPHNFICSDRRKSFEVYEAEVLSLLSLLLTIIYIYIYRFLLSVKHTPLNEQDK